MRRCRVPLAVVSLVLFSLLAAGPASAGGPTSVLLTAPGVGRTASLYTTDADYATLGGLVGTTEASGLAGRVDRSGTSHESSSEVTVTWLIHDVQVWRVDRIYLGGADGPWIATQVAPAESGSIWDSPAVWHTPTAGKELTALLDRLGVTAGARDGGGGVLGGSSPGGDEAAYGPRPTTAEGAGQQITSRQADADTPGAAGWLWGLAGLSLGVGVGLSAAALRRRANATPTPGADPSAERAERDAPTAGSPDPGPDDQPTWSVLEKL